MLEQFKYDGSRKPDFQTLPTKVALDWEPSGDAVPEPDVEAEATEGLEVGEAAESGAGIRAFLKEKAKANLVEIENLQKALRSAKKRGVFILLHGLPYSGRAETSNFLSKGMKKGVKTTVYREGEHLHDFLWQMHRRTPKYGNICIMKGSVYADIPGDARGAAGTSCPEAAVADISGDARGAEKVRAFEKYLQESGIAVVRIFLHVSPKCQKNRMLEVLTVKPGAKPRLVPQDKGWRKRYLEEFANVVSAATPDTPWFIVPADDKWYARCAVTEIVRDALRACVEEGTAEMEAALAQDEAGPGTFAAQDEAGSGTFAAQDAADPGMFATRDEAGSGAFVAQDAADPGAFAGQDAAEAEAASAQEADSVATLAQNAATESGAELAQEAAAVPGVASAQDALANSEQDQPDPKAEEPSKTPEPTSASAKKETKRRPRRQGPPKTVEETLARRRKRMESGE